MRTTIRLPVPALGSVLLLVLLAGSATHAATRTWNGGGTNNNWNTAANWDAPIFPGADLVFPGGAGVDTTSLNNTNNLGVGGLYSFNSITISGTNYTLRSYPIILLNGISHQGGGTNTVALDFLQLNAHQRFEAVGPGQLEVSSAVNLNGHNLTNNSSGRILLSGLVTGAGDLIKNGIGTLRLLGMAANTYVGSVWVNDGLLELNKTLGVNAISGPLTIGDGLGEPNTAIVRLLSSSQIQDAAPVTITSSGLFDSDGFSEVVGALSGTGNLQLDQSTFSVGFSGSTTTFGGVISGSNNLIRNGSGIWILNGTNTFSGIFTINGPTFVNGVLPANITSVSSTLGGTGTVGRVSVAATGAISPGLSVGMLTSSNVTFFGGSTFRVELNGPTPGTGHDQLKVNGAVTLGGAMLNATLGFPSSISNSFTIIDNDGTEAVTNTFFGLPEGATVNVSGTPFAISYTGGTGNDVVLTQLATTQQPLLTIQRSGNTNVVLSWARNFNGFTLEASTNLGDSVWSVVSPAPAISGTNNVVTNAVIGSRNFYRLRAP